MSKEVSVVLVFGIIAVVAVPQAAFAAEVHIEIVPGATTLGPKAYQPNPAQANKGDTVIWTNNDSTVHTATTGTAADGPTGECGGTADEPVIIPPSRTQQCDFNEMGKFPYYCVLHPTMVGTIIVGEPLIRSHVTVMVNEIAYKINAESKTTRITDGSYENGTGLTVSLDKAGNVTLEIPKAVSANVTAITLNGEVLNHTVQENGESATTIVVTVPKDNVSIVIVPEFPFVWLLVAGTFITLISFLKIQRKRITGD